MELRGYRTSAKGFEVTAVVPLEVLGLPSLKAGAQWPMDVGYIFGNVGGLGATARGYWHNNSFTANVVNDIPNESRLEPADGASPARNEMDMHELDGPSSFDLSAGTQAMEPKSRTARSYEYFF